MTKLEKVRIFYGLLFCSPWLIGFFLFLLYPIGAALYYSFCHYSVLLKPVFIGLDNYRNLFSDDLFWKSLGNTAFYGFFSVGLSIIMSLTLALLLNNRVRGIAIYRTLFFIPSLMPIVAISVLWMWIYNGENGILNSILSTIGINGPAWLADPLYAKSALVIMSVWGAGHAMVIFLAGLQDVPIHLYEAAVIDGAGWWHRLIHITLPMISPVIYFNLLMGIIHSLQVFTQAFIMMGEEGAPQRSTLFYVLYLFNKGFADLRMGYACAMSWVLLITILILTLVITRISKKWVHYERV